VSKINKLLRLVNESKEYKRVVDQDERGSYLILPDDAMLTEGLDEFVVNISNIGNLKCDGYEDALNTFNNYVKDSKQRNSIYRYGSASGESITLFKNGEIIKEYEGTKAKAMTKLSQKQKAVPK